MPQEERTVCYDERLKLEAYRFKGLMQKFPNHFHPYYVIGYIESGRRLLSCKNKEYAIGPGDLLMFNPMDNHSCQQTDGGTLDYRCINIKPEIMLQAAADITGTGFLPQFREPVAYRSEHINLLRELHQAVMDEQAEFDKEELFLLLLEQLLAEYAAPASQPPPKADASQVDAVCRFIDGHFSETVTLEDLGRMAKMNRYTLLRAFTRLKGITPYRYLVTVRINEAKRLLENGVPPVDAALLTGFADQSHFTNFFRGFIGLTPKQYQNIFKGGNDSLGAAREDHGTE